MRLVNALVLAVAAAELSASAVSSGADCYEPAAPKCAPPPCQSCRTAPTRDIGAAPATAPEVGVAVQPAPAMFAAPTPSGEISGERRGFSLPALELTLPSITLQTPQLRVLGAARHRRDAYMTVDGGRAPLVSGAPAMYAPVSGAGFPITQAAPGVVRLNAAPEQAEAPAAPAPTAAPIPPSPTAAPHCAPAPGYPPPCPPSTTMRDELDRTRQEVQMLRSELARLARTAESTRAADLVQPAAAWERPVRSSRSRLPMVGGEVGQLSRRDRQAATDDPIEGAGYALSQPEEIRSEVPVAVEDEPLPVFEPAAEVVVEDRVEKSPAASTAKPSLFRRMLGRTGKK